ncbi:MAG: hypothetical protein U1D30_18425 [Planctomycetota bacterium]
MRLRRFSFLMLYSVTSGQADPVHADPGQADPGASIKARNQA